MSLVITPDSLFIGEPVTSGTTGSVLFVQSGLLEQDNSNFFYDDTNNFLRLKQLKFITTTETSAFAYIDIPNSTVLTLDITDTNTVLNFSPTVVFEQPNAVYAGMLLGSTIRNPSAEANGLGVIFNIFDFTTISANAQTVTCDQYGSFAANPSFSKTTTGVLTCTIAYGLVYAPQVNTGATVTASRGVSILDGSGGGLIGTQYGVYVASLAKGGTNFAISTQGTTPSQFGGKAQFGTVAAPSAVLDIDIVAAATDVGLQITGHSSQSANLVTIERSDGTDVFTISPHGKTFIQPASLVYSGTVADHTPILSIGNTLTAYNATFALNGVHINPNYNFTATLNFGFLTSGSGLNVTPVWTASGLGAGSDSAWIIGVRSAPSYNASGRTCGLVQSYYASPTSTTGSNITFVTAYEADGILAGTTGVYRAFLANSNIINLFVKPTTYHGFTVEDVSGGYTNFIGFYQRGTNAHNRFVGDTVIGTDAIASAYLEVTPASRSAVTTEKCQFLGSAQTITINSGGTLTNQRQYNFTAPVINGVAGGGTETVTNASTMYISGPPAGSNITFTNGPYSLFVDAGISRFDGALHLNDKVTIYNGIATVSNGVPSELATVDLVTQAAAIGATTIYTPAATGLFRVSVYLQVTRAATSSSILGGLTLTYNDGDGNVAQTLTCIMLTNGGANALANAGNTTATTLNGTFVIYARTGVAIQYAIGYTSVGATTMQYAAHLKVEAM